MYYGGSEKKKTTKVQGSTTAKTISKDHQDIISKVKEYSNIHLSTSYSEERSRTSRSSLQVLRTAQTHPTRELWPITQ